MLNGSDYVFLKDPEGRLTVPVLASAYTLTLDLEARGVHLRVDAGDILASPRDLLTAADREAIKSLKPHLRHLLTYTAPAMGKPH